MTAERKIEQAEKKVERELSAAVSEIEALAEEIRVRVHLGGMNLKDAWRKLEPRLDDAKRLAKNASEGSAAVVADIKEAFRGLAAKLRS